MYATEAFARYATAFQEQALPDAVLHHAKRAVVDWYASLLPGLAVAPVPQLQTLLASELGQGRARRYDGRALPARSAALLHGTAAHAAEVDDSFRDAMYHPGAATVAAALAAAQECQASGRVFLRGVVLGYEVSTRIGVALGRSHYRYWHNTGTVGTFGAAAAASSLHGLGGAAFAHALATAATFAAGLQQAFRMDSMSKPLHAGRAAQAGLLAAQLARQGVTASLDVLDGDAGLGRAMSDGPDWGQAGATLGHEFHITRTTVKNHIGCGHTFAAIDATLELVRRHGLRADEVRELRVGTYGPALDIACHADPRTEHEARFSLPFVVATAVLHGSVRLNAYTPERLADPRLRALMGRVSAEVDPAIDGAFPGRRAARVEILTHDGRRLAWMQPDRKGDPELPLSDGDLNDKLLELATPVVGPDRARALLEAIWALDGAAGVGALDV